MLKEKVRQLPETPGVYLMKDLHGQVVYVGKAKALKNRVSSYFRHNKNHSRKVLRMVAQINDFDTVCVPTELDALLVECSLIQHYHPLYNRQLNASKNYCYLLIQEDGFQLLNEWAPQAIGPFRWYKKLPQLLQTLTDTYQMPWLSEISRLAFESQLPDLSLTLSDKINEIRQFFLAQDDHVIRLLKQRQENLCAKLNFEAAAKLQSEIELAEHVYFQQVRLRWFQSQPFIAYSLPILSSACWKHYGIEYGRLMTTAITDSAQNPLAPTGYAAAPLTKKELDPCMILVGYLDQDQKKSAPTDRPS